MVIPRNLTPKQTELLKDLAKEDPAGQTTVLDAPVEEEGLLHKLWNSVWNWNSKG